MLEVARDVPSFLIDGGEVGALMRAHDWAATPLGQPESWPQPLKTLVGVMLASRQPMLIVWGPEHTTLYNDGYAAMCGARHPAALGRPFDELWADIWDKVEPILLRSLSGQAVHMDDIAFVMMRNGYPEEAFFAFGYNPVRDETGEVAGMFCTCTETTARVRAEREASAAFNRLRDLFKQAPGFMCVLRGPEHVFELVNASYQQLVGGRDPTGKSVREALPEVVDQGFFELLDKVYATGEPFIGRGASIMLRHGPDQQMTERFLDFVYQPIHDDEGRVTGIFVEGSDVTEAYLSTEALKALTATLEQRVEERTRELQVAEEQLRQAQKMEAVGQLTGGIAHDFNNLLTIIKSSTELLGKPNLPEERRVRYVGAISDTVDRASKLTGQLLAFARRQSLTPEIFDVNDRVHRVTDMLGTIVGARIRIERQTHHEPCHVEADVSQFETALVNLAVNARDAMEGEGVLSLSVHCGAPIPQIRGHGYSAAPFVAVSMRDTGSGIPEDKLSSIFEPFFTTKEVGKGTGLGLSQVFGFAKQSGGNIEVESEVGTGTTFTLYLPQVEADSVGEADGAPVMGGEFPEGGGGRRVLMVEDNIEVGAFATQLLEDLGYETTWAASPHEALRLLADDNREFDIVFSDVVMPGMNGVEMGREIRRLYGGLPVILTSGYSHVLAEDARHGFELLRKPYSVQELSKALRRASHH